MRKNQDLMQVIEYDAAEIAWVDPMTGLPCLLGQNDRGLWFIGVGVGEGHPWHGVVQESPHEGPHCVLYCGGLEGIECSDMVQLGDGSLVLFGSRRIWWVALTGVSCTEDEATTLAVRMAVGVREGGALVDWNVEAQA